MTGTRTRRRIVVDQSELAQQIGSRLRTARLAARLTQQQLASPRYTKAYVSALENGLSRPSMAALTFFSERLGLSAERFLGDGPTGWARLEADLAAASRHWQEAADAYRTLLTTTDAPLQRAELLLGLSEALVGLDLGPEAVAAASEAVQVFASLGHPVRAARARYWLALGEYAQGDAAEGTAMLKALLDEVHGGASVAPDFELRIVMALATAASRSGDHATAVAYLDTVRALADRLDDQHRAVFYHELALHRRETGDYDGATRAAMASSTLYRASGTDFDLAGLENDLALSNLALERVDQAEELAASARARFERLGDDRWLADVLDTQARIALARGSQADGMRLAREALDLAERTSNTQAEIDALVTLARADAAEGQRAASLALYERAAELARRTGSSARLREVLGEWAERLADVGEHERAFELMREALKGQ